MNYYEHHIGDFDQATAHLSAVEDGIYSRMIRRYMATEKPLPAEISSIQRLVRARDRDEKKAVEVILAEFFELADDGWHQHRCDEEIARYQDKQAKAKRSAEARWGVRQPQSEGNADAYANASPEHDADDMRTHCEGNAPRARTPTRAPARPQTPDSIHQTPDTNHQSGPAVPQERPRRATRLPADWYPPTELEQWAKDARPDLNVSTTTERFRDYWAAKSGKDATKLDWNATFRNWVRSERAQPQQHGAQRNPTAAEQRVMQAAPGLVAPHLRQQRPTQQMTIDEEADHVPAIRLG